MVAALQAVVGLAVGVHVGRGHFGAFKLNDVIENNFILKDNNEK
jgi:hypothetical protein